MKNRVFISIICFGIIITSCFPFYYDKVMFFFNFYNNSGKDVYAVIDINPQDEEINVQSLVYYCNANDWRPIQHKTPWYDVVKDSMYLYVIDESKIHLSIERGFTQENAEELTPDMVLARFTIYHQDLYGQFTVSYPYKKTY